MIVVTGDELPSKVQLGLILRPWSDIKPSLSYACMMTGDDQCRYGRSPSISLFTTTTWKP